ncbi:MAG: hypothetical protein M3P18_24765 [Actinomycetota bacterium]|nr:hypothetical protein [Actinomycetota bacterium]
MPGRAVKLTDPYGWELPHRVATPVVALASTASGRTASFAAQLRGPPVFGLARGLVAAVGTNPLRF